MLANNTSSVSIGWFAILMGGFGLLGFVFIILFFSVGQPFGTLNDYCIGITAILSLVLAWMLYPGYHSLFPLLSKMALIVASLGAVLVLVGSILAVTSTTGWFLSGLYMAAGNALIGLWLLVLSYSALRSNSFSQSLIIFGIFTAMILALGLVAIPGIFRGLDPEGYEVTFVNVLWWISSIGYLALLPSWSIFLGRMLLHQ